MYTFSQPTISWTPKSSGDIQSTKTRGNGPGREIEVEKEKNLN